MSVDLVARTLCRVALLYCFTLFATAMSLAAAYTTVDHAAYGCTWRRCVLTAQAAVVPALPPAVLSPAILSRKAAAPEPDLTVDNSG